MSEVESIAEKKLAGRRTLDGGWMLDNRQVLALPIMFIIAMVVFSIGSSNFFSADNFTNVSRQSVYLLIVALGQLIVIINGGLDLSVGSTVALTSVCTALVMAAIHAVYPETQTLTLLAGLAVAISIGVSVGVINGLGVSFLKIPPFMMTLGMTSIVFGITLFVSGGVPIYGIPPMLGDVFGFGRIAGFPIPAIVALVLVLLTYILLEWTRFGRQLYATGGNSRAAELSGVNTFNISIIAFVLSGVFASITGFLLTARLGTGEANVGASLPLESIAACVISGVALSGGKGRTLAVLLGAMLIMLVQNGLNLMQVGAYAQSMATGGILLFAMALARQEAS